MKRTFISILTFLMLVVSGLAAKADSYACKEECSKCISVCQHALVHCTAIGAEHAQTEHIKVLKDCITACQGAAMSMAKTSTDEKFRCETCLDACSKCAESCDSM